MFPSSQAHSAPNNPKAATPATVTVGASPTAGANATTRNTAPLATAMACVAHSGQAGPFSGKPAAGGMVNSGGWLCRLTGFRPPSITGPLSRW